MLSVSRANFSLLNGKASKLQVFENLLRISGALLSTTPPPLIFRGPRDTIFMQMLSNFAEVAKYGYYNMWLKFKENRRHQLFNFPEYWLI